MRLAEYAQRNENYLDNFGRGALTEEIFRYKLILNYNIKTELREMGLNMFN
jgi:hypothetical protein